MLTLLLENATPTRNENDEWRRLYFAELNSHLRSAFDLLQKTAAGTFVINPALGGAFAYANSKGALFFWFAIFVCAIGICFNIGALNYFLLCVRAIDRLVDSIEQIGDDRLLTFRPNVLLDKRIINILTVLYFCLTVTAFSLGAGVALWRLKPCFTVWTDTCLSTTSYP